MSLIGTTCGTTVPCNHEMVICCRHVVKFLFATIGTMQMHGSQAWTTRGRPTRTSIAELRSTHGARTLRRTVQSPRLGGPGRPSASVQLARALPVYVPA